MIICCMSPFSWTFVCLDYSTTMFHHIRVVGRRAELRHLLSLSKHIARARSRLYIKIIDNIPVTHL